MSLATETFFPNQFTYTPRRLPALVASSTPSPHDSPVLVAKNAFLALSDSSHPEAHPSSDDEESTDDGSDESDDGDDRSTPISPNMNRSKPVGNRSEASKGGALKQPGEGAPKRKSARSARRYEKKLQRAAAAAATATSGSAPASEAGAAPSLRLLATPDADSADGGGNFRSKGKRSRSNSQSQPTHGQLQPQQHLQAHPDAPAPAPIGEPILFPGEENLSITETSRADRREQQKQDKKLAKKERKAAARQAFEKSDSNVSDDPLVCIYPPFVLKSDQPNVPFSPPQISAIPQSANAARFQYKIVEKNRHGQAQKLPGTPQLRREQSPEEQPRYDPSHSVSAKAPKRRRAQSFIEEGESPAVPSKVLERYPDPSLSRTAAAPAPFESRSPDIAQRKKRFKHFKPIYQPRSPSPFQRRQLLPNKQGPAAPATGAVLPRQTLNQSRGSSGRGPKRQRIEADADEDPNAIFQPRAGQFRRKRSTSLVETTPVDETPAKKKYPLVDLAQIMQEEMQRTRPKKRHLQPTHTHFYLSPSSYRCSNVSSD